MNYHIRDHLIGNFHLQFLHTWKINYKNMCDYITMDHFLTLPHSENTSNHHSLVDGSKMLNTQISKCQPLDFYMWEDMKDLVHQQKVEIFHTMLQHT